MFNGTRLRMTVLLLATASILTVGGRAASGQGRTSADVQQHKQTLLQRMQRPKPTLRGNKPGEQRVKWEWYDSVVGSYQFEKNNLLAELSAGEKFLLREQWVFNTMKMTFQEIFDLGPEDDDKLLPILSHLGLLTSAPSVTFEGLTLYGKQGELKGPVTRKYWAPIYVTVGYSTRVIGFEPALEYKNEKGELKKAGGVADDAFNVRWKDIKNRIADEVSEEKAAENRKLLRDAREELFREIEKIR